KISNYRRSSESSIVSIRISSTTSKDINWECRWRKSTGFWNSERLGSLSIQLQSFKKLRECQIHCWLPWLHGLNFRTGLKRLRRRNLPNHQIKLECRKKTSITQLPKNLSPSDESVRH